MKKLFLAVFISFFFAHVGLSDTYVWEDYDDFSGSSLDTNKWGTKYLGGGIEPYVSGGKLILSGHVGNPSANKVVKAGWEDIFDGDDGGQAWVYPKDTDIVGIEAEFLIPSSTSSMSGLVVGVASLSPLSYAGAELNADPNSASQYSQGFGFYHLANDGSEVEKFGTTQRDTTHRLGATLIDGIIKLYVDGGIRHQGDAGTFNTDMFYINGFNDYQSQGLAFELTADNARVLRRVTTTTLDGSVLILSSTDDVSETLSFENGTFISTFQDPTEGTFVDTDKSYILDEVSSGVWKITLDDGDTYSFDASTNSGTLVDYENGQIDTEGTWSFTFERHDWEAYDDFSGSNIDTDRWSMGHWDGGNLPIVENERLTLTGNTISGFNEVLPTAGMLEFNPDIKPLLEEGFSSSNGTESHSILELIKDDILGIEVEVQLPADAPSSVAIGLYASDWAKAFSEDQSDKSFFGLDLWRDHIDIEYVDPNTGEFISSELSTTAGSSHTFAFIFEDGKVFMFVDGGKVAEFSSANFSRDSIVIRAWNTAGEPFSAYAQNVRVLRRSHETTEPNPVTVVSDPNGQVVVVQVGDAYKWSSSLDGVTLWGVEKSSDGWTSTTMRFENGRNFGNEGFYDSVAQPQPYDVTFEIDENGYIKSLEDDGDYQYYNPVSVENGVIGTIQNDEGVDSVANNGINQVDQWFFTTRAAAEEYYYSKVNPKSWMWFDHYPWVYSEEEQGWLYFYPSGGKLLYYSNKSQVWREFNQ